MKTLECPMAATTLTKEHWDALMSPILRICLPKGGYSSNFPHAIMCGPTDFGGQGLMHPWYNQELSHLETFWEETSLESHTGELFGNLVETLRLELGFPGYLTSIPYTRMEMCATTSWITKLWASSSMFNMQIHDPFPLLRLSRVNDQHIMPTLAADPHLSDMDLQHLNECRMFKEAVTLAHLTTVCGRYLEQSATTPQKAHTLQTCTWLRKPTHLPPSYWTLWKTTILLLFTHPTSTKGELTSPLDEWTIDPTQNWTWWPHRSDSGTRTLCQKGNLYHHSYTAPHRSRRQTRLRINTPYRKSEIEINFVKILFFDNSRAG